MKNNIHPTAVIYDNVDIGKNVYIGAGCIIGAPGEHKGFWNKKGKGVVIMDGTIITGNVCIDAGTSRPTVISKDCFIMKGSYIAHDCFLSKGVTLSAGVKLAGFVEVGINTNLGMGAAVHQRIKIPNNCMIGMNSTVIKDSHLINNGVYVGSPVRYIRSNDR